MITVHPLCRFATTAAATLMMLMPELALGDPRESSGDIESRVADGGKPPVSIEMNALTMDGEALGTIAVSQRVKGLVFEPALKGLRPGLHGFHLHENASCEPSPKKEENGVGSTTKPAAQAGGHWDPGAKGHHAGPWKMGHLGDLPNLYVNSNGVADLPVYAPRLDLRDLESRALVVHARRDHYTDEPDGKGGSGKPVACGILKQ